MYMVVGPTVPKITAIKGRKRHPKFNRVAHF